MDAFDSSAGRTTDEALVDEGIRLGATLDDAYLVLVLGNDARLTALAALGVARAQARRRRVALGDLLGDAEPIQSLLDGGDPHGLADSFVYGVSLNKIARPVPQFGDLYVLPSGSEVPAYEDIFTNSRWNRLAAGFRETGAILVIAAPARAAHVTNVVRLADGVVLVGDAAIPDIDDAKVLGRVGAGRAGDDSRIASRAVAPNAQLEESAEPPADAVPKLAENAAVPESSGPMFDDSASIEASPRRRRFALPPSAIAGVLLAVLLAGLGIWFATRPLARYETAATRRRSTFSAAAGTVPSTLDSLRADSAAQIATPALEVANPRDSLGSAAYAVVISRFNTQAGAIFWFQTQGRDLPEATFAPVLVQGTPWFRALAGSYPSRAQADSLLSTLRQKGLLRSDLGEVVHVPLAFLVDSVKAEAVPGMIKYFTDRGQPVYALRQPDGSARLYAGAFETPQEAALYLDAIRTSGIRPVLVYRIGRVF
jgi:MinD-like ATPase involved in chromosome partitioning or flagellar assembly